VDLPWKAGVAKTNITPQLPIWLSGYGGRNHAADKKLDDLWAKALVLEDAKGHRGIIITVDLVGVSRDLTVDVCRRIEKEFSIPRSAIAICASHTHSGPIVRENLEAMFALDAKETERVRRYGKELPDKLLALVHDAVESMAPARLAWGSGRATFAVNRRTNPEAKVPELRKQNSLKGPVDHDVPVLALYGADNALRAVVAGYACHATVLSGYEISADWPGAFQREFERRHPGTIAMYWEGCGADQNPLPRRSISLMKRYGAMLADTVDDALGSVKNLAPQLETEYEEIALPFAPLPTRAELEAEAAGMPPHSRWAKYLLSKWDRDGGLPSSYPYPVQAWRLGDNELTWIFLGGEVVVDYALVLKSQLGANTTWIASYSNDVMGYIPSRRVLAEGGYEGGEARIPYGLPAVWDPKIEQQIIDAVHQVAEK
jgi:hypothetical protein